jgi:hypothetical protein
MKERLNSLPSEVGESFDYLKSDVRNLGRYLAELEELVEGYRTFIAAAILSTPDDLQARRKLLKRTFKIVGPPKELPGQPHQEAEQTAPDNEMPEKISTVPGTC